MKRNVDLTENEIFSNNHSLTELLDALESINRAPWLREVRMIQSDADLMEPGYYNMVITGDKTERERMRQHRRMDSNDYCDCCGKRMNLKPWDREYGVCRECAAIYYSSMDRCLWRHNSANSTEPLNSVLLATLENSAFEE